MYGDNDNLELVHNVEERRAIQSSITQIKPDEEHYKTRSKAKLALRCALIFIVPKEEYVGLGQKRGPIITSTSIPALLPFHGICY